MGYKVYPTVLHQHCTLHSRVATTDPSRHHNAGASRRHRTVAAAAADTTHLVLSLMRSSTGLCCNASPPLFTFSLHADTVFVPVKHGNPFTSECPSPLRLSHPQPRSLMGCGAHQHLKPPVMTRNMKLLIAVVLAHPSGSKCEVKGSS